jgi:Flp pilus assembly protein TadG
MRKFLRSRDGNVIVEAAVMMMIIFLFVFGGIDFLFAFQQWNAATKAVEVGARIAAVSDPVAIGLNALSAAVVPGSANAGDQMPAFTVICNGGATPAPSCSCTGTCTGVSGYSSSAMNTIVYGRGSSACNDATSTYTTGMCDIFLRITPANVVVTYTQTGLGYAGRPGGPAPTITVSLQNLPFQFYFLAGLFNFNLQIPTLTTTITGEDLSSSAS